MGNLKYGLSLVRDFVKFVVTNKPQFANYDVTWKCNLNCEHCYWKKYSYGKKEPSDEDWERAFMEHKKNGMKYAMLTGGGTFFAAERYRNGG